MKPCKVTQSPSCKKLRLNNKVRMYNSTLYFGTKVTLPEFNITLAAGDSLRVEMALDVPE